MSRRVYEDMGAHPRRPNAKKIVSFIPGEGGRCATGWRCYFGYYTRGGCMALYPADAETAAVCGKDVISLDLIRDGR